MPSHLNNQHTLQRGAAEMRLDFTTVCPQGRHSSSVRGSCEWLPTSVNMWKAFGILVCFNALAYAQQSNSRYREQYQEQTTQRVSYGACNELNERYPVSGSCDRYIECINGTSEEKLCPDGLRFNPNVKFNAYPCQYPNEVPCLERSSLQPAQPTDQCPHQFGYFKIGDARNCSHFRTCIGGVGFDFTCPEGLAYSSESYRCEWPDEVADCDVEAFLGFRCPEVPTSRELGPPAGYRFYRSEKNCQKYFMCIGTKPRILSCGTDSAYDELTNSCVSADEVAACPEELRIEVARNKEEARLRLEQEIDFNSKNLDKRRYKV